ncbi:MAG: nucleotidyltransferase [Anaerolineales bacterium]|nr:nucleotidyltransferase [Anaerolineales bacterium]
MIESLKIFIPMAGWGTRMRPHTWSKPKPLVSVAGKTTLEHLMDMFKTLPNPENVEYVFIVGPYLGELHIPAFIQEKYPEIKAHYIVQHEMKGQSHALWLGREFMHGPLMVVFSDSIIGTDFSFLNKEEADSVVWVLPVEDPRRFGVVDVGGDGWVKRFIEKPSTFDKNLALIGCYWFKSAERLLAAIEEQMERNISLKGEYYLADTISVMIEGGAKVRTHNGLSWLDAGTIEATLDTNKILLEKMGKDGEKVNTYTGTQVKVIEPCAIDPTAEIVNSTIGPHASIGANCKIENSSIAESIVEAGSEIQAAALSRSMVGRQAKVRGRGDGHVIQLNVGDNSEVVLS